VVDALLAEVEEGGRCGTLTAGRNIDSKVRSTN